LVPNASASFTWKVPCVHAKELLDTRWVRRRKSVLSHSLSREPLAKYFGVLVDEEVLDGILVTLSGGRLRERPASS
jgi:hypothetical protein